MLVKNFMSRQIFTISPETSIGETASLCLEKKIDGVPVMQDGRLVGLVTKTHLIRSMVKKINPSTAVKEIMSNNVICASPEDDIRKIDIMYNGRYPVIENDQLVGFLTKSDIMIALYQIIDEVSGQMETVINSAYNPIVAINSMGNIVIWNQAAEKMTGLKKQEVLGKFINDIIPESELLKIVETGKSEYGIKLTIDNINTITNRAPIIKNNEIKGAVAVLYDRTELEHISMELEYVKSLNNELDAIIESSFDGLYITDGEGMTIRINKAIERITNLGEKDLLNKSMYELVESGLLSNSATMVVLEEKRSITTTLSTITGSNLLVSATPIFDEDGNITKVVTNVRDISQLNRLQKKVEQLEGLKKHFEDEMKKMKIELSDKLIYANQTMEKIIYQAIKIAEVDSTVLITGESGVGKELITEIIHENSHRNKGPFVKLNCAAIPENLLESELFGYEAGAFTGASKHGKPGLFEVASGGSLLLDEIGEIPMHLQVKLLRALQEREIIRVGGTRAIKVDVRIIAVTNQDLDKLIKQGKFREDLYYRLNVIPIHVPPLRERKSDIPMLVQNFLKKFNLKYRMEKNITPDAMNLLSKYDWPGNIRQLENLIERLVVTSNNQEINSSNIPIHLLNTEQSHLEYGESNIVVKNIIPLKFAVETVEKILIHKCLQLSASCHKAAEMLEVNPSTISRKARKYGIDIYN